MVDKSITKRGDIFGDSTDLALRDMIDTDESANARVGEMVDLARRRMTLSYVRYDVTSDDLQDLANLPSGIADNMITVGDKMTLYVQPQLYSPTLDIEDLWVTVTPIIYTVFGGDTEFAIPLETRESHMADIWQRQLLWMSSEGTNTASPPLMWDLYGASEVGLCITEKSSANTSVHLLAGVF